MKGLVYLIRFHFLRKSQSWHTIKKKKKSLIFGASSKHSNEFRQSSQVTYTHSDNLISDDGIRINYYYVSKIIRMTGLLKLKNRKMKLPRK